MNSEAEVGRFSVDIHSSACPGRDAPNAEAKSQRAGRTRRRRASIVEEHEMPKALKLEITSQDDDDDEYYQINVNKQINLEAGKREMSQ